MKKIILCFVSCVISFTGFSQNEREFWLKQLDKISRPVLSNLAKDRLKETMPVTLPDRSDDPVLRTEVAYLEAFARTLCGIAPWLNIEEGDAKENALRKQYREWSLNGLKNAVNPDAKDYMNFRYPQALVDASFLAFALVRCPWLWENTDSITKKQVVEAFLQTRKITPSFNNWILFSGMIEAFFCKYAYEWEAVRIEYGIRQFEQWYVGDGVYSDGNTYHWDYYNSYVIHPFLEAITEVVNARNSAYASYADRYRARRNRYAIIQERLINADGSFPATGRSIVYRGAAFHHLANVVWRRQLPSELHPAQVRSALTAVLKKTMESPTTFKDGWLTIGLYGSQPGVADYYNNTGSLYLCTNILLPLGLPPADEFWSAPPEKFTAEKMWSGEDVKGDHFIP
ncbi:MAG: DUF2264 domain-containing protein [Chitinophagaceae bacterium]|nr:DUF2264 domain-containing protein [Chitinophagaceae bacterium]